MSSLQEKVVSMGASCEKIACIETSSLQESMGACSEQIASIEIETLSEFSLN